MKISLRFFSTHWEWVFCFVVLCVLGMFLLGYDVIGLNGPLASVLGLVGGIVLPIVLLVFGAILAPVLFFVGGAITMVLGLLTALFMLLVAPILGFIVGAVVLPLVAFVTASITAILGWLATTWLGALLMPVINAAAPLVVQYGPWLAFGKNTSWLYGKVKDNRYVKKAVAAYFKGKKEGKAVAKDVANKVENIVDVVEVAPKKPVKKPTAKKASAKRTAKSNARRR